MLVKNIGSNLTLDPLNQNLQICIPLIYIFNNTPTTLIILGGEVWVYVCCLKEYSETKTVRNESKIYLKSFTKAQVLEW